jgi:hypothetical protein
LATLASQRPLAGKLLVMRRGGDLAAALARMWMKTRRTRAALPKPRQEAVGLREAQVVLAALRAWLERQERSLDAGPRRRRGELIIFRLLLERAE